jgi:hypothetical protein
VRPPRNDDARGRAGIGEAERTESDPEYTRRGRGRAQKTIALVEAAYSILEEIQPASVRAVCYRLFTEGFIDSMSKSNANTVSRLLVQEREEGTIPWHWIVDETREAERIASWRDVAEFGATVKNAYRRDYWTDQPAWIEVWSEKGTVRGTLAPVLSKYGITFRVMHGHGSATAIHQAAEESAESTKMLTVLYVGDHDPSGRHMSDMDLPERLDRYGGNVEIVRVAIAEQDTTKKAAVPHFSAHDKQKDGRYAWFVENYGERCYELDALSPVILRERVEQEILARLDLDAWNHAIKIEKTEIESLNKVLSRWPSILGQAHK